MNKKKILKGLVKKADGRGGILGGAFMRSPVRMPITSPKVPPTVRPGTFGQKLNPVNMSKLASNVSKITPPGSLSSPISKSL